MKVNPLYENLDTTFVDLDALVHYLRRRKFVGRIGITYTGYDAVVIYTPEGKLRVNEHDKISGFRSEGELAFKRILERTKQDGGLISVFRDAGQSIAPALEVPRVSRAASQPSFAEKPLNGNGSGRTSSNGSVVRLPDFPFLMANEVEEKARQARIASVEFETLIKLTSEMLNTVDQALGKADLNFQAAFAKACGEISGDYPFMDPVRRDFKYSEGKVKVDSEQDPEVLVSGVGEALRRIFARLNSTPRFGKVYRYAAQRLRALGREHRELYKKYHLDTQIESVLAA